MREDLDHTKQALAVSESRTAALRQEIDDLRRHTDIAVAELRGELMPEQEVLPAPEPPAPETPPPSPPSDAPARSRPLPSPAYSPPAAPRVTPSPAVHAPVGLPAAAPAAPPTAATPVLSRYSKTSSPPPPVGPPLPEVQCPQRPRWLSTSPVSPATRVSPRSTPAVPPNIRPAPRTYAAPMPQHVAPPRPPPEVSRRASPTPSFCAAAPPYVSGLRDHGSVRAALERPVTRADRAVGWADSAASKADAGPQESVLRGRDPLGRALPVPRPAPVTPRSAAGSPHPAALQRRRDPTGVWASAQGSPGARSGSGLSSAAVEPRFHTAVDPRPVTD
eukprot:TRINITY_DN2577_c0_g2_i1.p1 TRINITY_DN2577_c0_g2~~TRINITY_DN2577_c0_g2_i1.p1  ORF type:complete len:361 (+),score=28.48 TRINITY_DN2577_c0_g2_i1:85-1083(+)